MNSIQVQIAAIKDRAMQCSQYMTHLPRGRLIDLLYDMQNLFDIITALSSENAKLREENERVKETDPFLQGKKSGWDDCMKYYKIPDDKDKEE